MHNNHCQNIFLFIMWKYTLSELKTRCWYKIFILYDFIDFTTIWISQVLFMLPLSKYIFIYDVERHSLWTEDRTINFIWLYGFHNNMNLIGYVYVCAGMEKSWLGQNCWNNVEISIYITKWLWVVVCLSNLGFVGGFRSTFVGGQFRVVVSTFVLYKCNDWLQ